MLKFLQLKLLKPENILCRAKKSQTVLNQFSSKFLQTTWKIGKKIYSILVELEFQTERFKQAQWGYYNSWEWHRHFTFYKMINEGIEYILKMKMDFFR